RGMRGRLAGAAGPDAGPAGEATRRGVAGVALRRGGPMKQETGGQRELAGFSRPTGREVALLLAVGCLVLAIALAALGPSSWRIGLVGEWVTYLLLALALISWQPLRSVL